MFCVFKSCEMVIIIPMFVSFLPPDGGRASTSLSASSCPTSELFKEKPCGPFIRVLLRLRKTQFSSWETHFQKEYPPLQWPIVMRLFLCFCLFKVAISSVHYVDLSHITTCIHTYINIYLSKCVTQRIIHLHEQIKYFLLWYFSAFCPCISSLLLLSFLNGRPEKETSLKLHREQRLAH